MADINTPEILHGRAHLPRTRLHPKFKWTMIILFMVVSTGLFSIDLQISRLLFTPGSGFDHANNAWVLASYNWVPVIGRVALASLVAVICIHQVWRHLLKPSPGSRYVNILKHLNRTAIIALICAVLGPGLIVEGLFKRALCRPRPVQVTVFGGDLAYQAVPAIRTHAAPHRSFVSSHAAAGFWLMTLGLSCGMTWRRRWLVIGIVAGSIIGLGRMLQGGHFLTDVVFAFFAVWISSEIVMALDRRGRRPLGLTA